MRHDPYTSASEYRHLRALHDELMSGPLPATIRELVNIRVSQINGCGFCLALHTRTARRVGVSQDQLDVLAGWRESALFDEPTQAALQLAEAMIGGRVDEVVWKRAAAAFPPEQLTALLYAVALIEAFNRINVTVEMPADVDAFFKRTAIE